MTFAPSHAVRAGLLMPFYALLASLLGWLQSLPAFSGVLSKFSRTNPVHCHLSACAAGFLSVAKFCQATLDDCQSSAFIVVLGSFDLDPKAHAAGVFRNPRFENAVLYHLVSNTKFGIPVLPKLTTGTLV